MILHVAAVSLPPLILTSAQASDKTEVGYKQSKTIRSHGRKRILVS